MKLNEVTEMIDKKMENNPDKIVVKFYEMKVKCNLTDEEIVSVLDLVNIRLTNFKYKVYQTGQEYTYNNKQCTVTTNELLVAIKQ